MASRDLTGNQLLDALPGADRRALLPVGAKAHVRPQDMLARQDEPVDTLHFPITAVLSVVRLLRSGDAIEISMIGNEGMCGLPAIFDRRGVAPAACMCEIEGETLAFRARDFRQVAETHPALQRMCMAYANVLMANIGQGVACSRLHGAPERAARWLLMAHDRVPFDRFRMTHELLAVMLGMRRASVSEALERLKSAKAIATGRGYVEILDRPRLERMACECYAVMSGSDPGRKPPKRPRA